MKVTIKTKKGESFEIDTNSNDLTDTIKSKISTIKSIPNDQQRLIYDCTTLKDGDKIINYSIKDGSEIFMVQKQDALLLQSSKIFLDSSLIDRIHQSYIDLQGKPPVQDVTNLLTECISYLDEKLDFDTTKELFLLILSCFSQYPEECFRVFQIKYQKPKISSLHIILLTTILSQIPNSNYDGLISNCIKEIIPQLSKNQGNFNVQGFEITPEFQTIFISNLILSIKLTEQIVTSFYQYFFSNEDFTNLNLFIQKVQAENLLTKIPESAFVKNNLFLQLSLDNLANFISILTEQTFNQILPLLINFLEQKELPPNLASAFINKSIEFNIRPKLIDFSFKYYNEFKSVSFWEYLNKYKTFLRDGLLKKIVEKTKKGIDYFAKTPLVLKSVEHGELLPQEVLTYSLLNADSLVIYEFAFKSSRRIECNTLGTLEFWEHLLSIVSKSPDSTIFFNSVMENYAFYFKKYIKENNLFNFYDQLIFNHFPPNEKVSTFLYALLEKLPDSYRIEFHKHDNELAEKLINRKELPSPSCFKLFSKLDIKLAEKLIEKKESLTPQLLYNLASSQLKTFNISKIEIMKMTHEPHENLTKFIEENNYDLIANIDDEFNLSLIACSMFYSSRSLMISQVSGLTCEIFLPFLAIALNYKTRSSFKGLSLFFDHNFENLFIDSCNYLNRNPTPLQIASINSIIPKMSMQWNYLDTQSGIILNIFDKILDFIIKGEYKADPLIFVKAIFSLSVKKSFDHTKPALFTKKELINLIAENIPKLINDTSSWLPIFDMRTFNQYAIIIVFTNLIETSTSYEPIIKTIKFMNFRCINIQKLYFNDYSNINTAIHKAIYEEKWDDVLEILRFIRSCNKTISMGDLNFYGKKIPLRVLSYFYDFSKIQNVNSMITPLLQAQYLERNTHSFVSLFNKLMTNKSISIKYITVQLEKITSQQVISAQDISTKLSYFRQHNLMNLIEAIKHSYIFSLSKQKFIKKKDCKPYPITSMNFDFLATLIKNDSYQSFIFLQYIASYFPFLFEPDFSGADENNSLVAVNIVLPALNCLSQLFEDTEKNINNLKKAFTALQFLYSCLYSVKFLSIFVVWIFENITKLNESQVFGLSYILISLFKTDAINKIILAYAVKYNFLDIITILLNRKIPEGIFKQHYDKNLFELSAQYYRSFSNVRCKGDALFIEHIQAQKILTPFENHFNNSISICPTKITSLAFTFPHQTKPLDDLFNFIEDIQRVQLFWVYGDLVSSTIPTNKDNFDVSKVFKDDLPNLSEDKIKNMPQRITTEMHGYLLTCPKWTLNIFENSCGYYSSSSISLKLLQQIPEYKDSIVSTIEKLNLLKKSNDYYSNSINSYDYFKTKIISQSFYNILIKEASCSVDISPNSVLSNLLSYVNQTSLEFIKYLIQYISDYISKPQVNSQEFKTLLQILSKNWNDKKEIENEFLEKCGNKIIDIALSNSFRSNESIINSITSILNSLKGKLPKQAVQFVGLIYGYYPKLTSKAVDLYFRINDSESFDIMPIIKMRYKKDADEENPDFGRIKYYMENNPSLTVDCILTTKVLLSKVINRYQEDEYQNSQLQEMIIEIFNGVAPNPSLRNSIEKKPIIQNDKNDDLLYPVPDYIKQTDPIFWGDFYENNRPFLNEMFKKHESIVGNLSFLSDYNELISFHLRYLIFKKNLNNIHSSGNGVQLDVSRSRLLLDSFGYWCINNPKDFISSLNVHFIGENGSDSGGLTREWITYLVKELMKPETGLFVKNENQSYHLNPETNMSFLNVEFLKMAGAIIAISILYETNVNAHLTTALLRQILHQEIQINDMKDYDESLFNSFQSILNSSDVKPFDLVFSIDELKNGDLKQVNLIENGDKIEVTNENKAEYVNLYANFKLKNSVSEQIKAFCEGFELIICHEYIKMFTPEELDIIICGKDTIDIEDMKKNVDYEGDYYEDHPVITLFYEVISKWSQEDLSKLLLFITGSSKVGVCGFEEFRNNGNSLKITSHRSKDRLPVAHTCSKELVLPEYDNEKDMNDKLLMAIQDCHFGFS